MKLLYSLVLILGIFLKISRSQKLDQRILALSGIVFIDTNNNTLFDEGEPGAAEIPISLGNGTDYSGSLYPTLYTNKDGTFTIDGLVQRQTYEISFKSPQNFGFQDYKQTLSCPPQFGSCFRQTTPADKLKGDLLIYGTYAYSVPLIKSPGSSAGSSILSVKISIDLGYIPTEPPTQPPTQKPKLPAPPVPTDAPFTGSAISGLLFSDNNGNGIKDGVDASQSGLSVGLYNFADKSSAKDANGKQIPNVLTDANGNYAFENVPDGVYCVKFESNAFFNPGCVGQIVIKSGGEGIVPSQPSDGVKSTTIKRTGSFSLFPTGNSGSKGIVFNDKDLDGLNSADEQGVSGVLVKVYLPIYNFLFDSITTDSNGFWSFTGLPSGFPVRIEFIIPNDYVSTGSNLINFATVGSDRDIYISISPKSLTGVGGGEDNPKSFITSMFIKGAYNGKFKDHPSVVEVSKDAQGKAYQQPTSSYLKVLASHRDVGSVHGIGFDQVTGDKFVASYHKTNSDFGPAGSCAIYKLSDGFISTYVNFNEVLGKSYCGGYAHYFDIRETSTAGPLVGKASLGQLSIFGRKLYVTNLGRNEILVVPLDSQPNATNIQVIPVLNPGCSTESDWHIFPVTLFQGEIFTGGVCSGEKGSRLSSYILKYNQKQQTFSTMLFFTLNYARGCRYLDTFGNCVSSVWQKWQNNEAPQPILSSIIFDDSSRLIMAFKDRSGDIDSNAVPAHELLMACLSTDGKFYLENAGMCGGLVGISANQRSLTGAKYGPGSGNFFDNHKKNTHDYTNAIGAIKGGRNMIVTTGIDYYEPFEGSIYWFNTTNGAQLKGYSIYTRSTNGGRSMSPLVSMLSGLGDIASTYEQLVPQYRVGRVWQDTNGNGIQDAGENGISGISVSLLYGSQTTPTIQAVSDSNGMFKFQVEPNASYHCSIDPSSSPLLSSITIKNADPSHPNTNSDASILGQSYITNFSSSEFGGYYFNGCNFGFNSISKK